MKADGFKQLGKIIVSVVKWKMDPVSKLILLTLVGIPMLILGLVWASIYLLNSVGSYTPTPKLKKKTTKVPPVPPTDKIYYEVKKFSAKKYMLTQYVKFYVVKDNEFIDITNSLQAVYPEMKYYSGVAPTFKGSVVLRDYDIIQLQKNLGDIKLVRTVAE